LKALESSKGSIDGVMWLLAIKTLLKVDNTIRKDMINRFLKDDELSYRGLPITYATVIAEFNSPDEDMNEENFFLMRK